MTLAVQSHAWVCTFYASTGRKYRLDMVGCTVGPRSEGIPFLPVSLVEGEEGWIRALYPSGRQVTFTSLDAMARHHDSAIHDWTQVFDLV